MRTQIHTMKNLSILETAKQIGQEITIAGWVRVRRPLGKIIFFDLWDRSGLLQIVAVPSLLDETSKLLVKDIRQGYCIEVTGTIKSRAGNQINAESSTGTVELTAKSIKVINESKALPFDLDDRSVSEEVRLKYRYLDLRSIRMMDNLKLRSSVFHHFRQYLTGKDFIEVETPCLTKGTPEGSREYTVPSRLHPGKSYMLPQSPQQFKQLLMVAGVERYYQIARCFRDEDQRKDRQAEFTQLDLEMSFVSQEDILNLVEEMINYVFGKLYIDHFDNELSDKMFAYMGRGEGGCMPIWPRMTYEQAMKDYGCDKPDLRTNKDDPNELAFVWIIDFPMFAVDDHGLTKSEHHPFTAPCDEDVSLLDSEPLKVKAKSYDLVLNGQELLSGSVRIHKSDLQDKVFQILGLKPDEIEKRFGHMLEAFQYGAPNHAGGALGLDRLLMILAGEQTIREIIVFPKASDGKDLCMGAPSEM